MKSAYAIETKNPTHHVVFDSTEFERRLWWSMTLSRITAALGIAIAVATIKTFL